MEKNRGNLSKFNALLWCSGNTLNVAFFICGMLIDLKEQRVGGGEFKMSLYSDMQNLLLLLQIVLKGIGGIS